MPERKVDVAVLGAGPAGLAAAIAAKEAGAKDVVVIDRNDWLGGILPQCIHDGFGVEETGASLTGPEYAERYAAKARELGVELMTETMVIEMDSRRRLTAVNRDGVHIINAGSVVLATGCRERTRWSALIPGTRPKGIYTAGVAQGLVNLHNKMVGKKVVVLGSGNVGLIMARRMLLEGAKVLAVVEILPYATGLPRNVVQCLEDYDIPLYLGHTITRIHGREALEKVTISKVDKDLRPIKGTDRTIACDTLLLSLGLVPENELARSIGITLDPRTGGPMVNEHMHTMANGFYACGNCLHVHDSVDVLVREAAVAGKAAALASVMGLPAEAKASRGLEVTAGKNVSYVVPQWVETAGIFDLALRPSGLIKKPVYLKVLADGKEVFKKRLPCALPSTMVRVRATLTSEVIGPCEWLEVTLDEQRT
jgi:NADPH-dependent 2,4-dienoyl-CoA reductase/sulfur reductase-like enzyme